MAHVIYGPLHEARWAASKMYDAAAAMYRIRDAMRAIEEA